MIMKIIKADWPAAKHINAITTTRLGGFSEGRYKGLNLAVRCGDELNIVNKNRRLISDEFSWKSPPTWLNQKHSANIVRAENYNDSEIYDASFTEQTNRICVVLTADCLPILICDQKGTTIAAIHAGWRGLAAGIIENSITNLSLAPENILVWLGPAISKKTFEIGAEVRDVFVKKDHDLASAFSPSTNSEKWMADIYLIAKITLNGLGITEIFGGNYCTYSDEESFYSYRRDGETGRMGSFIWMD